MAKFLNTSAINYFLEDLIKSARERLMLISPFLKLNDRVKELIADKNRMKIDVRVVYGKNELPPDEIKWLTELTYIRTSYCKNLHAKCYLNEEMCIITSLNLYDFSQVNNNEMGILLRRDEDPQPYRDAFEEAQRIVRISDEVKISLEMVAKDAEPDERDDKLSTSKLAKRDGIKTAEMLSRLLSQGFLEVHEERHRLTDKGKAAGGEFRFSKQFGPYFIWPADLRLP